MTNEQIVEKCLELIQEIYDRGNRPTFAGILDPHESKATHYKNGRQAGLELCKYAIEEEFGIRGKKNV